jgi:hypothetical protein
MINEHTTGRHPSTVQIARWLEPNPKLPLEAQVVASVIESAAAHVLRSLSDGPELTAGLRKLVEAKDCFMRAALEGQG